MITLILSLFLVSGVLWFTSQIRVKGQTFIWISLLVLSFLVCASIALELSNKLPTVLQ